MPPKVQKHKINHRTWISTNGKVTILITSVFYLFFLFNMAYLYSWACTHISAAQTFQFTLFALVKYFLLICFSLKIAAWSTRHGTDYYNCLQNRNKTQKQSRVQIGGICGRERSVLMPVQLPCEIIHFLWVWLNFILFFNVNNCHWLLLSGFFLQEMV